MKTFLRCLIAPWYLLGWLSHVYLAFSNPQIYAVFGSTAILKGYALFWQQFIMPRIIFFALLLAVFEIAVGICIIYKGKWVKIGLIFSVLFNLFLIQMGLGMPSADVWADFLSNRLPNIIFILIQLPLIWGNYPASIPEWVKKRFAK
jgi:hypothetical protein